MNFWAIGQLYSIFKVIFHSLNSKGQIKFISIAQ